jgi:hypothetical protein
MTIACGLIGVGCAVTLPNPAWPCIDVDSPGASASPAAIDAEGVRRVTPKKRSVFPTSSDVAAAGAVR